MSTPFVGQLLLASFNFAPKGYALCNGQTLAIGANQALFSLLGTTFGGNGVNNFQLPNLQGRTPVGFDNGVIGYGEIGGVDAVTLLPANVPSHVHQLSGTSSGATVPVAAGNIFGTTTGNLTVYAAQSGAVVTMDPATISSQGGSQPHENRQPYLVMTWCIALSGIFPTRS
jgi:microcystin-dependent protein